MDKNSKNIVKDVCRELGVTQKELAEIMGLHERTPTQWIVKDNIPEFAMNFMNILVEKNKTEKRLKKYDEAFKLIGEAKKE